jgi:hypothetical protein
MRVLISKAIVLLVAGATCIALPVPGQKHRHRVSPPSRTEVSSKEEEFYVCPMHADVLSDKPGKCPKCGMTMVRTARPEAAEFGVEISTTPKLVKAGEKFRLSFNVSNPKTGVAVKEFNIVHDMPFHLFVVSQDLNYFSHIHPEQQPDGSFTIETTLPNEGSYLIYSDIFPKGGLPQVVYRNLVTAGFTGDLFSSRAKLEPDKSFAKTVSGVRFDLAFDPVLAVAGKNVRLKYHLIDEKTGTPVQDLQPYLGAWGHTLILSEDARDYIHSHPTELIPDGVDRRSLVSGPDVSFDAFIPRAGNYRIWSQFQRQGRVITVDYTIAAKAY